MIFRPETSAQHTIRVGEKNRQQNSITNKFPQKEIICIEIKTNKKRTRTKIELSSFSFHLLKVVFVFYPILWRGGGGETYVWCLTELIIDEGDIMSFFSCLFHILEIT